MLASDTALTNLFVIATESVYLPGVTPAPEISNRDAGAPASVGAELTVELSKARGTLDKNETTEVIVKALLPIIEPFSTFTVQPTNP